MGLYIDFVQPSYTNRHVKEREVLEIMEEVYSDHQTVNDTIQMVTLCKLLCGTHKQPIKGITFASHGSSGAFFIGRDRITIDAISPRSEFPSKRHIYPALVSLKPFFDKGAWVRIDACECGLDPVFMRRLSHILGGVSVLAWTGTQDFLQDEWGDTTLNRHGKQVLCVSQMCKVF